MVFALNESSPIVACDSSIVEVDNIDSLRAIACF